MTSVLPNAVVVLHGFGPYSRGEILTDSSIISAIMSGGHASMVVPTQLFQQNSTAAARGGEH